MTIKFTHEFWQSHSNHSSISLISTRFMESVWSFMLDWKFLENKYYISGLLVSPYLLADVLYLGGWARSDWRWDWMNIAKVNIWLVSMGIKINFERESWAVQWRQWSTSVCLSSAQLPYSRWLFGCPEWTSDQATTRVVPTEPHWVAPGWEVCVWLASSSYFPHWVCALGRPVLIRERAPFPKFHKGGIWAGGSPDTKNSSMRKGTAHLTFLFPNL